MQSIFNIFLFLKLFYEVMWMHLCFLRMWGQGNNAFHYSARLDEQHRRELKTKQIYSLVGDSGKGGNQSTFSDF